jgi:hypothetical protein
MKCVILLKILVLGPRFSVFFIWSGSFLEDWKKFFIIFVIDKQFEFQTFALFYCVHVRCSPKHIQHLIIKMCTKSFTTAQHLQYHCRVHTGEKPYQCAVCLNSFASKSYLQIHIKIHTGENLSNVQCAPNFFYGQVNWKVTWEPTVTNWLWGKLFLLLHIILLYILGYPISTILYICVQKYPCKRRTWYKFCQWECCKTWHLC